MGTINERFAEYAATQGFTADEAATILATYRRLKVLRVCKHTGQWSVTHGALLDREVMARALASAAG